MNNQTSSINNKKKFLILGCGFSGSFFAKTIRQLGYTALTSSRSKNKDSNSFVFDSENGIIPNTKIFSYTSADKSEKYRMFRCGPKRAGIDFEGNRSIDEDISVSISSELIDQSDVGLTTLLLPEIDLGLDENDFLSIMSYEGFQLK